MLNDKTLDPDSLRYISTPKKTSQWLDWQKQCIQRKAWIESLNAEWRSRVAARKAAIAQWDAHVEEARIAYQAGKLTQPPEQPPKYT